MNLTPEVANLLRQALAEADWFIAHGGPLHGLAVLHLAVSNLLEPLPEAPALAAPTVSEYDGGDLPF